MHVIFNRILISVLIFAIFLPFINYDNGVRCIMAPCDSVNLGSFLIYALWGFPYIHQINYLILIGGILASYLISHLIIKSK